MSKIGTFLDHDALEFNPELHAALFEGFDEKTTVVELYRKMDKMYDALTSVTPDVSQRNPETAAEQAAEER